MHSARPIGEGMVYKKIILLSALTTAIAACTDGSPDRESNRVEGDSSAVVADDAAGGAGVIGDGAGDVTGDGSGANSADGSGSASGDGAGAGAGAGAGDGAGAGAGDGSATGADDVSGDGDRVNLLGLLKLEPNSTEADFATALFGRIPNGLTGAEIQNFYAPTSDTCSVTPFSSNDGVEPQLNVFGERLDLISAGETVVLSSGAGTFATLSGSEGSAGPIYRTDVVLNIERPGGLFADVLGDEFPAFSDAPIGDVPALQITNPPAGQPVDAFNLFTWDGNEGQLSVVEFYTGGIGANNQEILVGCTTVDDGSFSFPESVRAEMGDNFQEDWSVALRVVYNISRNRDAVLVTANSVFGFR